METPPEGADIMGGHLEGPFINPDKLGAQPNHAIRASRALLQFRLLPAPDDLTGTLHYKDG